MQHLKDSIILKMEKLEEEDIYIVDIVKIETALEGGVEERKDTVEIAETETVAFTGDTVKTEQLEEEEIDVVDIVKSERDLEEDTEDIVKIELEAQKGAKAEIKKEEDIHIVEVGETEIVAVAPAIEEKGMVGRTENKLMNKEMDIDGVVQGQDGEGSSSSEELQPRKDLREYERGHRSNIFQRQFAKKLYECDVCQYRFKNKCNLEMHLRTHNDKKPYKCSYCLRRFSQHGSLKSHLRLHTEKKTFKCSHCQRKFSHKGSLKIHLRTHTGEEPYECDFCQYSFKCKSNLVRHLRTHTREKPYKCPYCLCSFTRLRSFKSHSRLHTGVKPYKCVDCQPKLSDKNTSEIHLRLYTDGEPDKCVMRRTESMSPHTYAPKTYRNRRLLPIGNTTTETEIVAWKADIVKTEQLGEEETDMVKVKIENEVNNEEFENVVKAEIDAQEAAIIKTEQSGEDDMNIGIVKGEIEVDERIDLKDIDKIELEAQEAAMAKTELKEEENIHIVEVGETEIVSVAPAIIRKREDSNK